MIRSMTGYGQGTAEGPGVRVVVDVRSVNNRFADVRLRLPESLASIEPDLRRRVVSRVRRGRVDVDFTIERASGAAATTLNRPLVEGLMAAARELSRECGIPGALDLSAVLHIPGVVQVVAFTVADDVGRIINPMIVDGQIHGGLSMGLAPALFEEITYDENGNIQGGSFMDYLVPTAMETPNWETGKTVTPSPHHPFGAKGVGESATVGAPPAIVNAVVDALAHLGVKHIDIPMTPEKVWMILKEKGVAE